MSGNNTLSLFIKDINFETGMINSINFIDEDRFIQTIFSLNRNLNSSYFALGDRYMAVRNDSSQNILSKYVEEAYIFKNTYNLMFLEARTLKLRELFKCYKLLIDISIVN